MGKLRAEFMSFGMSLTVVQIGTQWSGRSAAYFPLRALAFKATELTKKLQKGIKNTHRNRTGMKENLGSQCFCVTLTTCNAGGGDLHPSPVLGGQEPSARLVVPTPDSELGTQRPFIVMPVYSPD